MNILITGATGLVGKSLVKELIKERHQITRVIRRKTKTTDNFNSYESNDHNNLTKDIYVDELMELTNLDVFHAVINLAGEPIMGKRWSNSYKEKICNSRWGITKKLTELINNSEQPPHTFISASAIGIYPSTSKPQSEFTDIEFVDSNFTQNVCKKWENFANSAIKSRVCIIRSSLVMSTEGGMLAKILPSFRLGLGASLGNGTQHMSFIHIMDEARAIMFLLNNKNSSGAYNLCINQEINNKDFSKLLAKKVHRPQMLNMSECKLKLILGESSQLLIDDQYIIPQKLIDAGFKFNFDSIDKILSDLIR